MMRKIYLTIGVDVNDKSLSSISSTPRFDIGSLVESYPQLVSSNLFGYKPKLVSRFIQDTEGDLIIGFAIDDLDDYIKLKESIDNTTIQIVKVFIKIKSYYEDYKKLYSQHSNWLDYHPDYVREKEKEYKEELARLQEQLILDGVDIQFIIP